MKVYRLSRGAELIEVLEGREARRDQLIAAGYEWVNREPSAPAAAEPAAVVAEEPRIRAGRGQAQE